MTCLTPEAVSSPAPPSCGSSLSTSSSIDGVRVEQPAVQEPPFRLPAAAASPLPASTALCPPPIGLPGPCVDAGRRAPAPCDAAVSAPGSAALDDPSCCPAESCLVHSFVQADSSDDITVSIDVPSGTRGSQISADFQTSRLDVKLTFDSGSIGRLSGSLTHPIVPDGCAFHLEGTSPRRLVLDLQKKDASLFWHSLLLPCSVAVKHRSCSTASPAARSMRIFDYTDWSSDTDEASHCGSSDHWPVSHSGPQDVEASHCGPSDDVLPRYVPIEHRVSHCEPPQRQVSPRGPSSKESSHLGSQGVAVTSCWPRDTGAPLVAPASATPLLDDLLD